MKVKYGDRLKQKVIATTTDTLVVGVDIARNYQGGAAIRHKSAPCLYP